ncbi:hypothetical protein AALK46_13045 [Staphylococcus nepalensis]|uniref:hypothetical protein n=1 Tax=Staphylococcus TaxID=1279 RepID=UPI002DBDE7E8|nr:hypothetical protein [Staphylococcus pseudoxylosus]MEB6038046.1 hypothetical protein [Staphylococcus pseudoxylosus]
MTNSTAYIKSELESNPTLLNEYEKNKISLQELCALVGCEDEERNKVHHVIVQYFNKSLEKRKEDKNTKLRLVNDLVNEYIPVEVAFNHVELFPNADRPALNVTMNRLTKQGVFNIDDISLSLSKFIRFVQITKIIELIDLYHNEYNKKLSSKSLSEKLGYNYKFVDNTKIKYKKGSDNVVTPKYLNAFKYVQNYYEMTQKNIKGDTLAQRIAIKTIKDYLNGVIE